ncbi:unnamed protein product [Somion occarium]|uniref:Uncharacterized protein n=1 Tax=Somion occarium TaxID=3059160 RepID=A0ABP1DE99_9APHY
MLSQHQHAVPPSDLSSLQEVQNRLTDLRAGCSMKLCDDRMQIWSIVLETRSYLKSAKEWRISVEKALPQLNNDQNQTFSGTRSRSIPSRSYSLLSSITEILPVALSKFPKGSMTNLKECLSEDDPSLLHNDPSAPQCTGHPTKWVSVARRSATLPTPSETHAVTDCTSVTEPSFNLWLETYLRSNVFDEDTSKKIRDMIYHVPIDKELDKSTLEDIHMLIVDSGRLIDASSFIQELVRRRVQPEQCFKELTTAILPRAGSRPSRSQTFPPINEVRDEAVETVESMLPAYLDFSHAVGHVDAEEV